MKEVVLRKGVYPMDQWQNVSPKPRDVLDVIRRGHSICKNGGKDATLALFVYISCMYDNVWRKVKRAAIVSEARKKYKDERSIKTVEESIDALVVDGLLEVQRHTGFLARLVDIICPKMYCPTKQLLEKVRPLLPPPAQKIR